MDSTNRSPLKRIILLLTINVRAQRVVSMAAEKKGELIAYLIGFFISLGFTIFITLQMIEVWSIQQDIAENLGIPFIYDPFSFMYILLSLVPTLFFLGKVIKILGKMNRAQHLCARARAE